MIKYNCYCCFDYSFNHFKFSESNLIKIIYELGDFISLDIIKILDKHKILDKYLKDINIATKNNPDKNISKFLKNNN